MENTIDIHQQHYQYLVRNDYGGIEDIVIDDNTKLIEEHLCITIDEFCEFLVDGKFTYDRSEASDIALKLEEDDNSKFDEVKNMRDSCG
jgi:hypothetical protein